MTATIYDMIRTITIIYTVVSTTISLTLTFLIKECRCVKREVSDMSSDMDASVVKAASFTVHLVYT